MVLAKLLDAIAERFPANDGAEVAMFLPFFAIAVESADDSALEVDRPTFVEPEVLP